MQLPLGYHEVTVSVGGSHASTRCIVTPERAYMDPHLGRDGRAAGIAVSLYGVRSLRNWGCGDFHDLKSVIDWVADELGASFVSLNPLHAIHNRRPFNTSPYLPNCIFYQNFLYLDVEGMEDFARCRRARALRETPEVAREIEDLRATPYVEYERVSALKLCFLKLAFAQFLRERRAGSARRLDVDRLAGALPGPRLGGDTGLPPEALAPRVGQPEPSATRPSLAQVCVDMFRP